MGKEKRNDVVGLGDARNAGKEQRHGPTKMEDNEDKNDAEDDDDLEGVEEQSKEDEKASKLILFKVDHTDLQLSELE